MQIYSSYSRNEIKKAISDINNDLDQQESGNGLSLNPFKSKCIVISRNKTEYESLSNVILNDCIIEYVDKEISD